MSDERTTSAQATDVQAPAPAESEAKTAENAPTTNGEAHIANEDVATAGTQITTEATGLDSEKPAEGAAGPNDEAVAATSSTPASANKKEKRKSAGGVPEHKNKKVNRKKSLLNLNLNLEAKPGAFYWARLKGYPKWPSVICDEQMLPEILLGTRPVSTTRPDGSIRDDFKEGGKNAKERTFPVMFLGTNEFIWLINTALTPLTVDEVREKPPGKVTKSLQAAYNIAAEEHDLDYFKKMLTDFQEEKRALEEEEARKETERAEVEEKKAQKAADDEAKEKETGEKPKKKKARKSKGGDDDDVEMEDAEAPKSSKKRKKEAESDVEGVKPKKTPKVMKLNAPKTPNGESSAKKPRPKKKVTAPKLSDAEEEEVEEKKPMTEAEKLQQREKAILYLRHRLQKGFLSRDVAPKEEEMAAMADFFSQLETYHNLEPSIIRTTKIHKVLKAVLKIDAIPKDTEFDFKKRSMDLLDAWNKAIQADVDAAGERTAPDASAVEQKEDEPATNATAAAGAEEAEEKTEEKAEEKAVEDAGQAAADEMEKKVLDEAEDAAPAAEAARADAEGDVSMATASEEPAA